MAKCDACGRSATRGIKKSHSNVKTLKRQKINLQPRKIEGQKQKLCTKCLKTASKVK